MERANAEKHGKIPGISTTLSKVTLYERPSTSTVVDPDGVQKLVSTARELGSVGRKLDLPKSLHERVLAPIMSKPNALNASISFMYISADEVNCVAPPVAS